MKKKAVISIAAALLGLCVTGGVYTTAQDASATALESVTLENS